MNSCKNVVSVTSDWDTWFNFAKRDYAYALQCIKQDKVNSNKLIYNARLLWCILHQEDIDYEYAYKIIKRIIFDFHDFSERYINIYIDILSHLGKDNELNIVISIFGAINPHILPNIFKYYVEKGYSSHIISILLSSPDYIFNELLKILFLHSSCDYTKYIINSIYSESNNFNYYLNNKYNNDRQTDRQTLYFFANIVNDFSLADFILNSIHYYDNKFDLPKYKLERFLFFQPLQGVTNKPLLIVFSAFKSDIIEYHYSKFGINNLDKLYNTRNFEGMHFFSNQSSFNVLNVLDEFQLWYMLHIDSLITHIRNFINMIKPTKIITYGASSGGFAALLFGIILHSDCIIACSPQTIPFFDYMNEYRIHMNNKYLLTFNPFCYLNRILKMKYTNIPTKFILYTSVQNKIDCFHCDYFKENYHNNNLIINKLNAGTKHSLFESLGNERMRNLLLPQILNVIQQ